MDPVERLRRGHAVAILIRLGWKPPPMDDLQTQRLLDDIRDVHPNSTLGLTDRETEVLQLAADGFTKKRVAIHLDISPETVNDIGDRARRKLGATNTTHAVAIALREGLIT